MTGKIQKNPLVETESRRTQGEVREGNERRVGTGGNGLGWTYNRVPKSEV